MNLAGALALWSKAEDWPRNGAGWPADAAERAADALFAAHRKIDPAWHPSHGMPLSDAEKADIEASRAAAVVRAERDAADSLARREKLAAENRARKEREDARLAAKHAPRAGISGEFVTKVGYKGGMFCFVPDDYRSIVKNRHGKLEFAYYDVARDVEAGGRCRVIVKDGRAVSIVRAD